MDQFIDNDSNDGDQENDDDEEDQEIVIQKIMKKLLN